MTAEAGPPVLPVPPGLSLAPFRALRYDARVAGALGTLVCPPYDVVDDAGVRDLEGRSLHNAVRLVLPRGADAGELDDRYAHAARTLRSWRARGVLRTDEEPALYVYESVDRGHVQRGLLGALALAEPEAGIVLPHENVMAGPVSDRLQLLRATQTNTEPIFLVHSGGGAAAEVVDAAATGEPLTEVSWDDGVTHRLWAVTDPESLAATAADLLPRQAVIADGHHRYATMLRHRAEQHAVHGAGPWDRGLALLVDTATSGPDVHAIHRVVRGGLSAAQAAERAAALFTVAPLAAREESALLEALSAAGARGAAFVLADAESAWLLSDPSAGVAAALPADRSPEWRALDVAVLHSVLVAHGWGLTDDEATVAYQHTAGEALHAATAEGSGAPAFAVLLNPTPVDALIAVARHGERMPRKSTYFAPKPLSGLLLRSYLDA